MGVFAVAAAGVLYAFSCVVDALPAQCLRRRPCASPLVAAVFRTNRLLPERSAATCLRRRRPGQARRRQGRLQITAVRCGYRHRGTGHLRRPERVDLCKVHCEPQDVVAAGQYVGWRRSAPYPWVLPPVDRFRMFGGASGGGRMMFAPLGAEAGRFSGRCGWRQS